jgi:hypothetical protein
MAERGNELRDITLALDLEPILGHDRSLRERLKATVERGNAVHRIRIADRLDREGVRKGKGHPLGQLARNRLGFDAQDRGKPDQGAAFLEQYRGGLQALHEAIERVQANHPPQPSHPECERCLSVEASNVAHQAGLRRTCFCSACAPDGLPPRETWGLPEPPLAVGETRGPSRRFDAEK